MRKTTNIFTILLISALYGMTASGQQNKRVCLNVMIDRPVDTAGLAGTPMIFIVQVTNADNAQRLTFNWTVSAGTITSGQGTETLTVDTTSLSGATLTATVEVSGLPVDCPKTAFATTTLAPFFCGLPLDDYGAISRANERARLDNFANELANLAPDTIGYITTYGGRRGRAGEAQWRAKRAKNYVVKQRHIPAARIVTIDGGYREEVTTVLIIAPSGAIPPTASPTVSPDEVQIIHATKQRRRPK